MIKTERQGNKETDRDRDRQRLREVDEDRETQRATQRQRDRDRDRQRQRKMVGTRGALEAGAGGGASYVRMLRIFTRRDVKGQGQ